MVQNINAHKVEKPSKASKNEVQPNRKIPIHQYDIWEDYKQIYLDFSLNNEIKVRDKVLFINSIDIDFNPK